MNPDLDTLATALYVRIDDLLAAHPEWAPLRPAVGIAPEAVGRGAGHIGGCCGRCWGSVLRPASSATPQRTWVRGSRMCPGAADTTSACAAAAR